MTRSEFVKVILEFLGVPSVYAYGQMGTPISDIVTMEKCPYPSVMTRTHEGETTRHYIQTYNPSKKRKTADTAPEGTFCADCTGLVQLGLCGWTGDANHYLGGCDPDLYDTRVSAAQLAERCGYKGGSLPAEAWDGIKYGDIMFQAPDLKKANHCAVYIGNGKAVEMAYDWCGAGYGMTDGAQVIRLDGYENGKMMTLGTNATKKRGWVHFGTVPGIEDDPIEDEASDAVVIPENMMLVDRDEFHRMENLLAQYAKENAIFKEENAIMRLNLEKMSEFHKFLENFQ